MSRRIHLEMSEMDLDIEKGLPLFSYITFSLYFRKEF